MAGSGGLAENFEGMTCVSGSGYNTHLSCNEPDRASGVNCSPQFPSSAAVLPMNGTRDGYNVYDVGLLIPGDQEAERTLNCVGGAQ